MYTVAEVLNLLNVILQMFIMDRFLGGEFTSYGWEVLSFSEWDWSVRYDPMVKYLFEQLACNMQNFTLSFYSLYTRCIHDESPLCLSFLFGIFL